MMDSIGLAIRLYLIMFAIWACIFGGIVYGIWKWLGPIGVCV